MFDQDERILKNVYFESHWEPCEYREFEGLRKTHCARHTHYAFTTPDPRELVKLIFFSSVLVILCILLKRLAANVYCTLVLFAFRIRNTCFIEN